ncbi:MAG: hypothetical protein ACRAVC_12100 [Trichormus sp.]
MTDLLAAVALHDSLLVSIQKFLDVNLACEAVSNYWQKRHEVANHLNQVLPSLKQAAADNFDMISAIIKQ